MTKKNKKQKKNIESVPVPAAGFDYKSFGLYSLQQVFRYDNTQSETPAWHLLKPILIAALLLRYLVALTGDFVLHPDEIMQYLEPAHAAVFDSGVLHWEYYFGARTWIVPGLIACVLWFCKLLGLDSPFYYIALVKLLFCTLSVIVPYSMYYVGRALFNENTARIALVLGAFWYELIGFAHKPMTEFLATSLVFLLLAVVYRKTSPINTNRAIMIAGISVLIAAVRFHYIPIAGMIALVAFIHTTNRSRFIMIGSAIGFLMLIGLFEYATWGSFFHSYITNIKVNLLLSQGRGSESSPYFYLLAMMIASGGLYGIALISSVNFWRRGFIVLLIAFIVVPHMLEAHREYRFIYVALPLLLLLLADVLQNGLFLDREESFPSQKFIKNMGLIYAVVVSGLGISNAIPWQHTVYKANSQETGRVNFITGQDKIFEVYRYLADDPSVKGVLENNNHYFNGAGYYYLHQSVPYYPANHVWQRFFTPNDISKHVSHIVMDSGSTIEGTVKNNKGQVFVKTGDQYILLPRIIYDKRTSNLNFYTPNGAFSINGFELIKKIGKYTVWRRIDNTLPITAWQSYTIYPDNVAMHPLLDKATDNTRAPTPNLGIVLQ